MGLLYPVQLNDSGQQRFNASQPEEYTAVIVNMRSKHDRIQCLQYYTGWKDVWVLDFMRPNQRHSVVYIPVNLDRFADKDDSIGIGVD